MHLVEDPEIARCIFREAIDAYLLVDPDDLRLLDANPAAQRMSGRQRTELLDLRLPDLFDSIDETLLKPLLDGVRSSSCAGTFDTYRLRGDGGRVIDVQVTVSRIHAEPRPLGLVIVRDDRDRRRARESENHFRTLFDQSPDAIFVEDLAGNVLDANRAACALHGVPRERLVGTNVLDLVPPAHRDEVREGFARLATGELSDTSGLSRNAQGQDIPVELRVSRITFADTPALLLHVRDVTARQRAEESLRESQRFIERIAEASPHIMYVFDVVARRSVYANRQTGRDLGYSPDEIAEMGHEFIPRLLHPDDRTAVEAALRRWDKIADGEVVSIEYRMRHRDGSWHWLLSRGTVFSRDADGGVRQVIGTAEDITARKEAEEKMLASKQMLEVVMNNIPQGVFWKDRQSRYLGCNRVVAEALGMGQPAVIVDRTDFDLPSLTREQAAFFVQKDREVMESGRPECGIEEMMTLPDGSTIWLETSKIPLLDVEGKVFGVLGTWQNVTERKRTQEALQLRNQLLASLSRSLAGFVSGREPVATFDEMLQTLLQVTRSEYGFIGEVLRRESGEPYLKTYAISNIAWNDETRAFYERNAPEGLEFNLMTNLFGAVMSSGEPVIANDPDRDPRRGGLPGGHPPLRRFLGLPFRRGQELIGMAGVANRPEGYDHELIALLEPFLYTCASMIVGLRNDRDRQRAEAQMRQALAEKQALLKEIHHRVKNNLQIIQSLLNLQEVRSQGPPLGSIFAETRHRIRSMALLHETLYRTESFVQIDLRQYVAAICTYLQRSYGVDPGRVELHHEVEPLSLDMDRAIPCGLIINELVSNALKHAFPSDRSGQVSVRLAGCDGVTILAIADTGVGLPPDEGLGTRSLGLQLVRDLTRQLQGSLRIDRSGGTAFTITFTS